MFETISTISARRGSSVGAVIEVVAEGVPAGLGAPIYGKLDSDLAAALMGDQCGQRRRDRRRLCGRCAHAARTTPTRCAWATTASRVFSPTMPAAFSAEFRPASRSSAVSPSSRPRRSSPRGARSIATATRPRSSPRAGTTPASAFAQCRSARPWWHA